MEDLIRREDAINAIYHHLPGVSMERARIILHEVPSVSSVEDRQDTDHGCGAARE